MDKNLENFDLQFYDRMYPDLRRFFGKLDLETALKHWNKYGKREGRVCNEEMMINKKNANILENKSFFDKCVFNKLKDEEKINILICANGDKKSFLKCITSIMDQNYINYRILVSYQDKLDLNYLNDYDMIELFYHENNNLHNTYHIRLNKLLKEVEDGWIIILNEDEEFIHENIFSYMNENLKKNHLYLYKFIRPDKIIFPKSLDRIKYYEIVNSSFCFNKNYINVLEFNYYKTSIYDFFMSLIKMEGIKLSFLRCALIAGLYFGKASVYDEKIKNMVNLIKIDSKMIYDFEMEMDSFDSNQYIKNYPDLKKLNKLELLNHWNEEGRNIGYNFLNLNFNKEPINLNIDNKMFNNYQYLFYKFRLNLVKNPNSNFEYEKIFCNPDTSKKYICHIHIENLDSFQAHFKKYIDFILTIYDIIITFNNGDDRVFLKKYKNITILKTSLKGGIVGSKFCLIDFLKNNNIDFEYILFLNSNTDKFIRNKFISYFASDMKSIEDTYELLKTNKYGCIYPRLLSRDKRDIILFNNKFYINELLKYLGFKKIKNIIFDNHTLIMKKELVEILYTDKKLYNILNYPESFDYNWVNVFYNLNNPSILEVYQIFKNNKIYGNNYILRKEKKKELDNFMIENVFPKITSFLCKENNLEYKVIGD